MKIVSWTDLEKAAGELADVDRLFDTLGEMRDAEGHVVVERELLIRLQAFVQDELASEVASAEENGAEAERTANSAASEILEELGFKDDVEERRDRIIETLQEREAEGEREEILREVAEELGVTPWRSPRDLVFEMVRAIRRLKSAAGVASSMGACV